MKPKLNLSDPRVADARAFLESRVSKALEAHQRVEGAVHPIYVPLGESTKPEQIASGVIVRIGSEHFVFSASHVFDDIGSFQLLLGLGGGKKLVSLQGDRFSTSRGKSGTHDDDPIDASVFHIQSPIPHELAQVAITFQDLDFDQPDTKHSIFLVSGFRAKESKTVGRQAYANRACYPTGEYGLEEYSKLGVDKNIQIAVAFEDQILVNNAWQTSPTVKGVSGGAIVRIDGTSLDPTVSDSPEKSQRLTAIAIEQRREVAKKPGAIVGTRISVHLALISKFLPTLPLE